MVDVSAKKVTSRLARAEALVRMNAQARAALREATLRKGDALVAAQVAGIMAAKQTAALAALTIYDMAKALDKGITIESVRLLAKRGGKSGEWSR